jgi:hypothetical protein
MDAWIRLQDVAGRLSAISRSHRYDPYQIFDWPESLPADAYWMSPELMTCHSTAVWDELTEAQRVVLSHHEAASFFSLNVHLIRDLIGEVTHRIYSTRYPGLSEFFHDFIAEENVHAWFFATFCRRYGRLYPARSVSLGSAPTDGMLADIAVFGRILIAEELCDFFNMKMADDDRLPPIARQVNRVHHEDESRHIAFGRQIMRALCEGAGGRVDPEGLAAVGGYLARYVTTCLRSFYNPQVYADAGLPDPTGLRARVIRDPGREAAHRAGLGRTVRFLDRIGLLDPAQVRW